MEAPNTYDEFGSYITCRGEVAIGEPCNDYDACSENDVCCGDENFTSFRGTPAIGVACNDYNGCTGDDQCVMSSLGDFATCQGSPLTGPCDNHDACTLFDECVTEQSAYADYTLSFCRGTPTEGVTCNDYNDCTIEDTCMHDDSGEFAYCAGTPTTGLPCNDYNKCTVGDVCEVGNAGVGDYAICLPGAPNPGAPCNDYSDYTIGDVCVEACGSISCQGQFVSTPRSSPRTSRYGAPVATDTCM
jgi:hypothetical protein